MDEAVGTHLDMDRPSSARIYDHLLGGSHNFAVDREAAAALLRGFPNAAAGARANRSFLRRTVRFLVAEGVDQFLDLGSGIPTVGCVHEIAQRACPGARVVYVDSDPIAVAHSRSILAANPDAAVLAADLRGPGEVLADPVVRGLLDFGRPVAVLLVAVLHFIGGDLTEIVSGYRSAVPPGSFLVISHGSQEGVPAEELAALRRVYENTSNPAVPRTRAQITDLFAGFDLVDPGVVQVADWRPDSGPGEPACVWGFGGVGRKP
ncbi:MAG TPA: SAM-dependent methyltransferase [Mycobacteriales bacterium]|nr:SAM-dependent methyltransferase [Mycobacteriales bacterium]